MDDNILSVKDPRDAFMFMLLERINGLEDTVRDLRKQVCTLEESKIHFECTKQNFNSKECVQAVKIWFWSSMDSIEKAKKEMAESVNLIIEKLGTDVFKSASAVISYSDLLPFGYQASTCLYLNFKNAVWVHEFTRLLHQIDFTVSAHIEVHDGMICFLSHKREGYANESGIVYSAYDLDGNKVDEPQWIEWNNICHLLRGHTDVEEDWSDDGDFDD
jgi:hypothetical protein